jgi:phage terminase small subunit
MALTEQQEEFVREHIRLKCKNATQAAINAGYSENSARQQASRLLKNENIQEFLKAEKLAFEQELRENLVFECKQALEVEIAILNNPRAQDKDRLAAARDILDRAGFKPTENVNVSANVKNPFEGLSTEELKAIVSKG